MASRKASGSDTVGNMAAVAPARKCVVGQQVFDDFFSMMVDEALERMKKMLESNKAMQELVNGEAGEVGEKDM